MTNRMALVLPDKEETRQEFLALSVKSIEDRTCLFIFFFIEERRKDQFVFQQKD